MRWPRQPGRTTGTGALETTVPTAACSQEGLHFTSTPRGKLLWVTSTNFNQAFPFCQQDKYLLFRKNNVPWDSSSTENFRILAFHPAEERKESWNTRQSYISSGPGCCGSLRLAQSGAAGGAAGFLWKTGQIWAGATQQGRASHRVMQVLTALITGSCWFPLASAVRGAGRDRCWGTPGPPPGAEGPPVPGGHGPGEPGSIPSGDSKQAELRAGLGNRGKPLRVPRTAGSSSRTEPGQTASPARKAFHLPRPEVLQFLPP